jgi:hypothetical protein
MPQAAASPPTPLPFTCRLPSPQVAEGRGDESDGERDEDDPSSGGGGNGLGTLPPSISHRDVAAYLAYVAARTRASRPNARLDLIFPGPPAADGGREPAGLRIGVQVRQCCLGSMLTRGGPGARAGACPCVRPGGAPLGRPGPPGRRRSAFQACFGGMRTPFPRWPTTWLDEYHLIVDVCAAAAGREAKQSAGECPATAPPRAPPGGTAETRGPGPSQPLGRRDAARPLLRDCARAWGPVHGGVPWAPAGARALSLLPVIAHTPAGPLSPHVILLLT